MSPQAVQEPADWQTQLPRQLDDVRIAAAQWQDLALAKRAGWKPFGGEEPLMGQHFYNPETPDYVVGQPIDFSRPSNLMFAEIDGVMTLTGVAFVVRIGPDDVPPPGFAGPEDRWHVHDLLAAINAATEDRPFLRTLARWWLDDTYFSAGDDRYRLAMLHVWTQTENPDGVFADYDRTLPYRKLSLPVSWASGVAPETARGVHLAGNNGCSDILGSNSWIANPTRRQKKKLTGTCSQAADKVRAVVGENALDLNQVATEAWSEFNRVYEQTLSPDQKRRIAAITEHQHQETPMQH